MKLKLSDIWSNFDEFLLLCESGTNDTRHKIKFIKTYFDENNKFDYDWDKLLHDILFIFSRDKRLQKKFDYNEIQILTFVEIFKTPYSKKYKETFKYLFDKLNDNYYNGIQWGAPTKFYDFYDNIKLTNNPAFDVKIFGNKLDNDKFYVDVNDGKKIHNLLVKYIDNEYDYTINLTTGTKVQISKYKEIIHFINAKYFQIFLKEISLNEFYYYIQSFIGNGQINVPNETNGYLSSVMLSRTIFNYQELMIYINNSKNDNRNILFTFDMLDYNKFKINRKSDESLINSISEEENKWGKLKSANGSRKGRINNNLT